MMLNSKSLGSKITEARKKAGLSQAELAQQVSISPQAVGKWERGESMPDITTLNRLAEIFGVDLNYFSDNFQGEKGTAGMREHTARDIGDISDVQSIGKKSGNWDMSRGNWVDADFSGLKNLKEKFSSSNMKNCQFKGSDLSGLILGSNNIEKCDFSDSDLRDCKILSSNLLDNKFENTSFIDAEFSKCNIEKCDFSRADFSGAEISGVNLESSLIKEVTWKFTSFKKSNISKVVFEGLIEDCHFEHCSFYGVRFQDATILNTFFKYNEKFRKVQFVNCRVDKLTYAFLKSNQANLENVVIV